MQETWVRSLGWDDPLKEEIVTHSSILAWEVPWTEEPGGLQSTGSQSVRYDLETGHKHNVLFIHSFIDICLGLFHHLANEKNADTSMNVHTSLQGSSFNCLGCTSRNGVVAHTVIQF